MHNDLLGSGSTFDQVSAAIDQVLPLVVDNPRTLGPRVIASYKLKRFVVGWVYRHTIESVEYEFHVLLDPEFPRSPVRVAVTTPNIYMRWPHVEEHGVLCLPKLDAPLADPENVLTTTLGDAHELVSKCVIDPTFVERELKKEFLSYWKRATSLSALSMLSLITTADKTTRKLATWYGQNLTLVGDSEDQLRHWLSNRGAEDKSQFGAAIFGVLDTPPTPPFPNDTRSLFAMLERSSPDTYSLLKERGVLDQRLIVVLLATTASGDGLIAFSLTLANSDGFRPNAKLSEASRLALWQAKGKSERRGLDRIDPPWVHGRDHNEDLAMLTSATVAVIGCGSLGSQVAVRLAQAGVGGFFLVDPEVLEAANVGRHALGMGSLGGSKAKTLAKHVIDRFPHIQKAEAFHHRWQELMPEQWEKLKGANLIVSCIGEWGAEGALNEWHVHSGAAPPIVYGWLDENGSAAHAVAILESSPCLACILDANGNLRFPETVWKDNGLLTSEPACGTLFQPFGPIDVGQAEVFVSRLLVDILTGKQSKNCHRVWATSTTALVAAGGEWSETHLKKRPKTFEGAFEYERVFDRALDCVVCQE